MPCRVEEESVIPGLSLSLKQGSTLQKVLGEEACPDSAHHGGATKTTTLMVLGGASPNLTIAMEWEMSLSTHRKDREKVLHCLRLVISAHWRIMVHIQTPLLLLHSPWLCNETWHTTDRQTIPILINPCPQAIYKHQCLGPVRSPSATGSHAHTRHLPP